MTESREVYSFPPFLLDVSERALRRGGRTVAIAPRLFDVLVALVRNRGSVTGRHRLVETAWGGSAVEEASLTRAVSRLRLILGDDREAPRFIETVSKTGYRFIAPVIAPERVAGEISIAVLPFKTARLAPEHEDLGLGLADSLIRQLSQIRSLAVRPTSSVLRFGDARQDPIAAGDELGVDWLLDGRITLEGERIRISIQLVEIAGRKTFWAARFTSDPNELLDVHEQLAARILEAVLPNLPEREARLKPFTAVPAAHRHYLRGIHHMYRYSDQSFGKAVDELRASIDADPDYVLPHTALAMMFLIAGDTFIPSEEAWRVAAGHAKRALEAGPLLPEAHSVEGAIRFWYGWERNESEVSYRRGVELGPSSAMAHSLYAWYLTATGRVAEAEMAFAVALSLDPLSLPANADQALPFYFSGRPERAAALLESAIEMDPAYWYPWGWLGLARLAAGEIEGALRAIGNAVERSGGNDGAVLSWQAYVFARAGRRAEAAEALSRLETLPIAPWYDLAAVAAALGDRDRAFAHLAEAVRRRLKWVGWIRVDPRFAELGADERLRELTRAAGF